MWKKRILCVMLTLCAIMLCACQEKEVFSTTLPFEQRQQDMAQQTAQNSEVPVTENQNLFGGNDEIDYDDGSYDPASEEYAEDWTDTGVENEEDWYAPTAAPTMNSDYAGATPVIIDPIDKPTPTPLPPLTFTYTAYEAAKLHLTFEAPSGWLVDESQSNTYVLTNPDTSVDYAASMIITADQVSGSYNTKALTAEVKNMLNIVRDSGVKNFQPSNTAERTLLGANAVYANYTASLSDGTAIAGRIIIGYVDKTLYTLHISYPRGYRDTYVSGPYDQFRHTVKITQ